MTKSAPLPDPQAVLADLVQRRIAQDRAELVPHLDVRAEAIRTAVPPTVLKPGDQATVDKVNAAFRALSDEQLGAAVRQTERLLGGYVRRSDGHGAELLWLALVAFQAGCTGLIKGGSSTALTGIHQEAARFERALLLMLNAQREVVMAEARQFMAQKERDLEALTAQCRADVVAEVERLQAERQALRDTHEMALNGAEAAQAEASQARRALEAARKDHAEVIARKDAEIERLTATLRQERAATVERDRLTRNDLHQLRQDLAASQAAVGRLNADCAHLETLLAEATAPTPQEPNMTLTHDPLLAAHSLAAYLIAAGHPARVVGHEVRLPGGVPYDLSQQWGAAYPTDAARLAHLRGVVRPLIGRAA
ncbi:hypothetical protein [Deinococcus sp. NW-56]|uniref:hypothetical protein n=1 Tax=Deinococcus sp. NW-56 TaxID=2080419 RepID=UPI000CF3B8A5|nr:hypothetical protein [Deinococcus sp. NW-56]